MPAAFEQATFVFVSSRDGETMGRAERRILSVLPALLDRRAAVFVLCPPGTPLSIASKAVGATVVDTVLSPGHYFKSTGRVRALLRRHRPVCVHTAGLAADLAARRASRGLQVAVVNSIPCGAWPRGGAIVGLLDRRTLWVADRILIDCPGLEAQIVAAGARPESVRYDPPSVSVPRVLAEAETGAPAAPPPSGRAAPPPPGSAAPPPSGRAVVGFAGRLETARGIEHLLDAVVALAERAVDAEVRIAGSGPAFEDVKLRAEHLPRVELLGEVESVPAVLRYLDVAVFPGTSGGAPTALLEAAVLGRAIVASAIPGVVGLFEDGAEIALVPPGDPVALADAIARLVRDPAGAAEMGRRARLRALDEYSSTAAVERALALYREFLAR